jgi:hypothetical protein
MSRTSEPRTENSHGKLIWSLIAVVRASIEASGQCAHRPIQIDLCFGQMAVKPAFLQHRTLIDKWTTCRLSGN